MSDRGPALVSPANFILATRDSGYKSTALAVAEFIDNSIQAEAKRIDVKVLASGDMAYPIEVLVIDDGTGMDSGTLARALAFGGSSRFGDRASLGRYGMGLPNGALSRARRVEVYSWRAGEMLMSSLDVDEVVIRHRRTLPKVRQVNRPEFLPESLSGTAVRLQRCDRLDYKRSSVLVQRLERDLARIYRMFLSDGLEIFVNGIPIAPADPLFLLEAAEAGGGRAFGDILRYRFATPGGIGHVEVRFSELPIDKWHGLSSSEKRRLGVTGAPSVSVLRARREIDHGWYFMGTKRRENYDDWWRCEVSFDPELDEMFGITHSKQAISPSAELLEVLTPDMEPIARALNSRVRSRFELVKVSSPLAAAERQASRAELSLPAMPRKRTATPEDLRELLGEVARQKSSVERPYVLLVSDLPTTSAFEVVTRPGQLILLLNPSHPLFRDLYGPLAASESEKDQETAKHVILAILAAARAELLNQSGKRDVRRFQRAWGDVVATFFNA